MSCQRLGPSLLELASVAGATSPCAVARRSCRYPSQSVCSNNHDRRGERQSRRSVASDRRRGGCTRQHRGASRSQLEVPRPPVTVDLRARAHGPSGAGAPSQTECHLEAGGGRAHAAQSSATSASIPRSAHSQRGADRHPPSDHVASSRIDEAMRCEANPSAHQRVYCCDGGSSHDVFQFAGDAAEQTRSVVTPSDPWRAIPNHGSTAPEGAFGFGQADQPLREQRQPLS
jgi:hypothetical protein